MAGLARHVGEAKLQVQLEVAELFLAHDVAVFDFHHTVREQFPAGRFAVAGLPLIQIFSVEEDDSILRRKFAKFRRDALCLVQVKAAFLNSRNRPLNGITTEFS